MEPRRGSNDRRTGANALRAPGTGVERTAAGGRGGLASARSRPGGAVGTAARTESPSNAGAGAPFPDGGLDRPRRWLVALRVRSGRSRQAVLDGETRGGEHDRKAFPASDRVPAEEPCPAPTAPTARGKPTRGGTRSGTARAAPAGRRLRLLVLRGAAEEAGAAARWKRGRVGGSRTRSLGGSGPHASGRSLGQRSPRHESRCAPRQPMRSWCRSAMRPSLRSACAARGRGRAAGWAAG